MKKYLCIVCSLVLAVSLLMVPAVVTANPGTPTIDGIVDDGEWDGATVIDVTEGMGTVSVMADTDYLYVLFDVVDSTDARQGENIGGNDQTSININPTTAPWGKPCDIIFQTGADPAAFTTPDPDIPGSSGSTDEWKTEWVVEGEQLDLPGDLETMTLYDYATGTRISEWKLPLATIAPSLGDMLKVGGAVCTDFYANLSYVYPVGLDWGDPSTYVDILVQQPSSAVGVTAISEEAIIGLSVLPPSINFGSITSGEVYSGDALTVQNLGNVRIIVDVEIIDDTAYDYAGTLYLYTAALRLNGCASDKAGEPTTFGAWPWGFEIFGTDPIEVKGYRPVATTLECPSPIEAGIEYTGTVIFWAEQPE